MKDIDSGLLSSRRSVMSLYSHPTDPASHAVRLVIAEKAIGANIHLINEGNRPEDLLHLNPYGDILTLVDQDLVIFEPQIIMEYLDDRYPHPSLVVNDPVSRARNRLFRYRLERDIYPLVRRLLGEGRAKSAAKNAARQALYDHIMVISRMLEEQVNDYVISEEFSLADCFLAPVILRLGRCGITIPGEARIMWRYCRGILQREAFPQSMTDLEHEIYVGAG
ncbi:glutathione S-transferase N-terminal domain-containing protein [Thioalkalivibrio sp. HK1]|uniref:glutathione S-transferase N-terminal domain-containing protein n=1 Tax=Thioalkalivibrio sp. HK1 TaxID=1469245 RepID=UPI0004B94ADC|nr:glutathione S-transferase N-terminal domain-containing protein [Thioalkalivibrio sp. HK1]